jgi:hypothetical protein
MGEVNASEKLGLPADCFYSMLNDLLQSGNNSIESTCIGRDSNSAIIAMSFIHRVVADRPTDMWLLLLQVICLYTVGCLATGVRKCHACIVRRAVKWIAI